MPVSMFVIDSGGSSTNGITSLVTPSIVPSANTLLLLAVSSRTNITANPNVPTATGCNLTWEVVSTVNYDNVGATRKRLTVLRALGPSPTTGAVTIDFGGQAQHGVDYSIDVADGVDTSGTNGSGAIVQSATLIDETTPATPFTETITLGAFGNAANATWGSLGFGDPTGSNFTAGTGFTELSVVNASTFQTVITEYREGNDTSVTMDFVAPASSDAIGGVALEIRAAPGAVVLASGGFL